MTINGKRLKRILKVLYLKFKLRGIAKLHWSNTIALNSKFEGGNKLYPKSKFRGILGFGSYIGPGSELNASVGRYCSIGPNVKTIAGRHPIDGVFVSTSPVFYSLKKQCGITYTKYQRFEEFKYALPSERIDVEIGHDVWLGEGVRIIAGTKIGHGAIILSGSIVTKDVAPYTILGGAPAKVLRYRFEDKDIQTLLRFEWWKKDTNWLKNHVDEMSDIKKLKYFISNEL